MRNYIGFIDESGKIGDPKGKFVGYGLLRLNETHEFHKELVRLKSIAGGLASISGIHFKEFKFSAVGHVMLPIYKSLINTFFSRPENYFAAIIIDKSIAKQKNMEDWASYIHLSEELIREHVKETDSIFILADYMEKPVHSRFFYEPEVRAVNNVYNVCMMESEACMFIQLVDVLLGATRVAFEASRSPYKNAYRLQLSQHLRYHIGRHDSSLGKHGIARDFSIGGPFFFVREWK